MRRFVHRQKATGLFAVSHGSYITYSGTLANAKVYRNKNGGVIGYNEKPEDYEWVEVELTIKED